MDFNEFRKMICKALKEKLGEEYEVQECDVDKINNVIKKGINVMKKQAKCCPVLYLDKIYDRFTLGEVNMEDVIEYLLDSLKTAKSEEELIGEIAWLAKWEDAKDYVRVRLINTERNGSLLKKVPHIEFCNLSGTFYLEVNAEEEITAGISISYDLMKKYGVDEDKLLAQAIHNMDRENVQLMSIEDMINVFAETEKMPGDRIEDHGRIGLHVLTNKNTMYGAAAILSATVRDMIVKFFQGAAYVLPSSVHELILLPQKDSYEPEELRAMVKEINATVLQPTEFLADSVYLLDASGNLEMVA